MRPLTAQEALELTQIAVGAFSYILSSGMKCTATPQKVWLVIEAEKCNRFGMAAVVHLN